MKKAIHAYLKQIASNGGKTTKKRHGKDHYRSIGAKGLAKRWGKDKGVDKSGV